MPRENVDEAGLDQLLSFARLQLTPERKAAAKPALDLVLGLMDSLDVVDVGEVPPATAYDPRWK
jgi:Asp-tRNA(Asn)/Glu-tRNA(Gln) amidotransferase C subunit